MSTNTAIENTTLLITEIDLHYRKGQKKVAIDTALLCRKVAVLNELEEERLSAEKCISFLSKLCPD